MIRTDRTCSFVVCLGVFLALILSAAPAAVAGQCPTPSAQPKVKLQIDYGDTTYSHELNSAGIKNIINDMQGYTSGPWHLPLGLTSAQFGTKYETQFRFSKAQSGYCVTLVTATITLGYRDMMVYISNDYAEGSCQFDAILAHEEEHVAINQDTLRKFKKKFERAVRNVVRANRTIFIHRKADAQSAYIQAFQEQIEKIAGKMAARRNKLNGKIDTQKSYRRVHETCQIW